MGGASQPKVRDTCAGGFGDCGYTFLLWGSANLAPKAEGIHLGAGEFGMEAAGSGSCLKAHIL